jgi:hypothetical protein
MNNCMHGGNGLMIPVPMYILMPDMKRFDLVELLYLMRFCGYRCNVNRPKRGAGNFGKTFRTRSALV